MIIPVTFFFTFLQLAFLISSEQPPYVPTENITLNCGADEGTNGSDGRFWAGEKGSKFGPFGSSRDTSSASYTADTQGSAETTVPYMTARVSSSELKYTFPVTPGQKFVRLYFHPVSYDKFDRSKAFFSVKAGSFTLLSNFSALLVAESLKVDAFVREFCLNVEENQVLDLIFTPTPSASNDTYAFINGIEVVSMPLNLYYTTAEEEGVKVIGQSSHFWVNNYTALETVYRLNVGGQFISPTKDSGMFRLWADDVGYMLSATASYVTVNKTVQINYDDEVPRYTAPEEVYKTARTMGPNVAYNKLHNLTWEFPVDSGFWYMVRLHFCEMHDLIDSPGERVFQVFINNLMAETSFDVIIWTRHSRVPMYKDYVLRKENEEDLTIALHPIDAKYFDVILNGIEVFKLNNSDGILAGPNHEVSSPFPPPAESSNSTDGKSKEKRKLMLSISGGCALGLLVLLSLLAYMVVRRHKKRHYYGSYPGKRRFCWWINPDKGKSRKSSLLPENLCRHFSLDEIKAATRDFNDDLVIGKGGFGKVYKGFLDEGETIVAIKRLNPESGQGLEEFLTEIEMLSQLRHVHLVSLIGYCNEKTEMILVYDFMSNGTLSDHLYGGTASYDPLTWMQRLEICKGAAIGLNYLHTEVRHTIIHRDVKTSNILLDDKFTSKVSDFGLSKTDPKVNMLQTGIKGTLGYLDPEYARGHALTEKSDVYSFGVVLFEVLCARKALDKKFPEGQVNLAQWAKKCILEGTLYKVIDPVLTGKIAPECFKVFVEIAENCLSDWGVNRPSMNDVMEKLRFAIELQEAADLEKQKGQSYPDIVFPVARDMDFDYESETSDSEMLIDSSIFNRSDILSSYTTGMSSTIDSTSTSDMFSGFKKTKSPAN